VGDWNDFVKHQRRKAYKARVQEMRIHLPAFKELMKLIEREFKVDRTEILVQSRNPEATYARLIAMYLANVVYNWDYSHVGRMFNRNQSSVSSACKRVEDLRDNGYVDRQLERLEEALTATLDPAVRERKKLVRVGSDVAKGRVGESGWQQDCVLVGA